MFGAVTGVAKMTMVRAKKPNVTLFADIGLLIYPGRQLAAICGLTDPFPHLRGVDG